jgi:hypothetical protein
MVRIAGSRHAREIGVKPGMWFAPNLLWKNRVAPAWQDSYSGDAHRPYGTPMDGSLSFFEGGFLADFMQALEHWYGRGIRLFELDMLDLQAATPASRAKLSKDEIRERNKAALMAALAAFRQKCPEAVIVGFNGFNFSLSIHPVDVDWLKVLETCYAGDLRVTNVPHSSYWRATDYFGDERTRLSEENGVPLHRIDGCSIVPLADIVCRFPAGPCLERHVSPSRRARGLETDRLWRDRPDSDRRGRPLARPAAETYTTRS